jgi:hypothetical protein
MKAEDRSHIMTLRIAHRGSSSWTHSEPLRIKSL